MFFRRLASFTPPTLRQCLAYALPALILGAIVRLSYMVAIPEPVITSDTSSYLATGYDLWNKKEFTTSSKRRWFYPLVVAAAPILPGNVAQSMAAVQHLAGLGTVLAVGWIVGQLTRFWRISIPLATLLTAVWPLLLLFEHTFLAESLFTSSFILTVALALPVERLKHPHRLLAFLLALTFTVGLRPPGRAVWVAAVILLVLVARDRKAWTWTNIALAVLCTATSLTTGSDNMGSRLLLSSVLPLVDTSKSSHHEYRQALEPLIVEARKCGADYPWCQSAFKTRVHDPNDPAVGEAWKKLLEDEDNYGRVARSLAFETVLHHPFTFFVFTSKKLLIASASPASEVSKSVEPWEFRPAGVWYEMTKENRERWKKKGDRLNWIFGGIDLPGWEKLASERATRTFWFAPWAGWIQGAFPFAILWPGEGPVGVVHISWFGWLVLLGFASCLLPRRFLPTLMLWLPMLGYLYLTFGVGDRVPRFCVPVHWCWICLAVLAIDLLLVAGASVIGKTKEPELEAPPAPAI